MVEGSPSFDSFVEEARNIAGWSAKKVYKRYCKIKRIEFDDLFSVAFAAVWLAWKDYDESKATLSTHCRSRAIWACHDYCRAFLHRSGSKGKSKKFLRPNVVSLNAPVAGYSDPTELGGVVLFEPDFTEDLFLDQEEAWGYLDCLDHRSRHIVVETVMKGRTLLDLGREMGLTEGRMSQIRIAAIRYIHDNLRKESA